MAKVEKIKQEHGARKAKEITAPYSFPCRHLVYFKIGGSSWLLA